MSHTVLLADDDAAIRMVLNQALTRAGYDVRPTGNLSTMWNWVSRGEGDLLITDVAMPDGNAFDIMPKVKKLRPDLPIVVMSAQNTFMTAIRANEVGAYEYLPKPFDIAEVLSVVSRALADAKKPSAGNRKSEEPGESMPLVGRSAAMQDIYRALARLMQTDLTVMITGESGTGKELVARALHDFGKRRNGPFVAINMAAIPRDLIEAELFGHEKGAFTGATARSSGRFEQAEGGTLFLDEIGDMPMDAQTRLLRVLQEGEYTMVGGRTPIKSNVRIVAATHRDLGQMIRQGLFREDLFYRLNVVPIRLPPLRERLDDIPDLVGHFLRGAQREGEPVKTISPDAIKLMQAYSWPGNVRELENLVRRLGALYADESISREIVQAELNIADRQSVPTSTGPVDVSSAVETHVAQLLREHEPKLPPAGLYQRVIDKVEAPLIAMVLNACGGNQIKASELLGLNRNTLRKKIRAHAIEIVKHSRRSG
jgi:two-component system nitrogen regulation response regulator GlnG